MKHPFKVSSKWSCSFVVVMMIFSALLPTSNVASAAEENTEVDLSAYVEPFYYDVLEGWNEEGIQSGTDQIDIKAKDFAEKSEEASFTIDSYAGKDEIVLWKEAAGWIEYEVDIENEGLYEIAMDYIPLSQESGGSRQSLIFSISINDSIPFKEARSIEFRRQYKDREPQYDEEDNQIRSLVEEISDWETDYFRDPGANVKPLQFHLEKGKNTIRIQPQREVAAIESFTIQPPTSYPTYEEVEAEYPRSEAKTDESIELEAEEFISKNSTSIQVQYNRDPLTTPKSLKKVKFNTLGGESWKNGGQAVTWEFDVPETGVYKLGFRGLQNYRKSLASFRSIYVDGEIPFSEMEHFKIPYASKWQEVILQDEKDSPYQIYLEKGKHTLTFEATYEPFMSIISQIEEVSDQIKSVSQELRLASGGRMVKGKAVVDEFRVWNVEKEMPGLIEQLEGMHDQLAEMAKATIKINGGRNNVSQAFESTVQDLAKLLEKPNEIPNKQMVIGTMQEKVDQQRQELMDSPLEIDKLYLVPEKGEFPRMTANAIEKVQGTFNSLVYSFSDQHQLGEQKAEELNVWMMWGRDYAEELQQLANQYFTPEHGVKVNVNLIQDQNLLVLAKAAGIMPDVALGVPSSMPFEMALRGAAKDISTLPGAEEVIEQYAPGAMLPYYYDGSYYGIPETINFKVLFYRKDILEQLGLEVPETWDDVYDMIPTLLQSQYNFFADPKDFSYMLYQNGAELYTPDGLSTGLDQTVAYQGFKEWTDLFNLHGLDNQVQSFYQQFRKGTMPIGIADFNQYMELLVAAPEILDSWGIAPVPGHVNDEGEIIRWAGGTGMDTTSMMLFNDTPEEKQDLAWEFVKWYTSSEVQTEYGLNLEQFRGETFRWNSANIEAFSKMPWRKNDLDAILEQWKWVRDLPNVPGSYMTTRQLDFSWNQTVLENGNPRIELEKAIKEINRELKRKQIEFNIIDENGDVLHPLDYLDVTEPWEGVKQVE
ncbi:ABC transporter substrate-binding protein [Bacillus sp. J14TS2]|uniref:extracellular solute-binding protein n=1 Tax=Bacillus sp. J14TS2 TaxID=2807188 RepID=UPI001B0745D4|nr:extracellular solute-binding protein [Bacillus sp. J14TS2]GIN74884.1 ABC transporter substrate-binding protein [Bacillus sp. J14TS2]